MADDWADDSNYPLLVPTTTSSSSSNNNSSRQQQQHRARRKSNFTQAEVNMLYKMMRKYAKHLRGRVSSTEELMERRRLWMKVVDAVNSVSVEERTLVEIKSKWKKCRYDDELGERKGGMYFFFSFVLFFFCL